MEYPEEIPRLQALLFTVLGFVGFFMMIPHFFMLWVYSIGAQFLAFFSWWAILFTGRYPAGWWDYLRKFLRYQTRLNAYMGVRMPGYPPFGLSNEEYPVDVVIPYPERSSRLWLFLAGIAVFPVAFVNGIFGIAAGVLDFLGRFAVLFTGRYPAGWWEFIRKVDQQRVRIFAFAFWLRNEYPPFGLDD